MMVMIVVWRLTALYTRDRGSSAEDTSQKWPSSRSRVNHGGWMGSTVAMANGHFPASGPPGRMLKYRI